MKKAPLVLSFLLAFSLFCFISATRASANNKIMVGVFYYPWYDGEGYHCNGHPRDYGINLNADTWWSVVDEPVLGNTSNSTYCMYASDNVTVIEQHLKWFENARMDFGIISWWGPYSFEDNHTDILFSVTSKYAPGFRWVISIEGGEPKDWQQWRDWVYYNYTLKYHQIWLNDSDNKPFLFWMNSDITNDNATRNLIESDHEYPLSMRTLGQANYSDWKTWTPYTWGNATSAFLPNNGFMCVMPRYDETRLDRNGTMGKVRDKCADPYLDGSYWNNTDPLNEPLYDYQWKEVLSNASAGRVQYVGIATWNDFTERTQIEPCYDNTSAYKDNSTFLLDKTKYYISLLKDSEAPTISMVSQVPSENVTEYQNVTVYANVTDTESGVNRVLLNWTTNVTYNWSSVLMTPNSDGFYEGVILGQKAGASVNYSLTAYDNAGNWRVDDNQTYYYNYVVIPEFSPLLVFPLFILATLTAVIVYKRKRIHLAQRQNHAGLA
jgi:hypothetical protein